MDSTISPREQHSNMDNNNSINNHNHNNNNNTNSNSHNNNNQNNSNNHNNSNTNSNNVQPRNNTSLQGKPPLKKRKASPPGSAQGGGKEKKKKEKVIGTHDGTFHCDEVLACWMLKQVPQFKDAKIMRTHLAGKLKWCHVVVDIGGVYEPSNFRFDHHQRDFTGTMKSLAGGKGDTKLSSAGLVYLHFGKDVIAEMTGLSRDDPALQKIYNKLYSDVIEEIDARNNNGTECDHNDAPPRYHITTSLCSRVEALNPLWNAINPDVDALFHRAMKVCLNVCFIGYFQWISPGRVLFPYLNLSISSVRVLQC